MRRYLPAWFFVVAILICAQLHAQQMLTPIVDFGKPRGGSTVAFDAVQAAQTASAGSTFSWTHTPVGTPTAVAVVFQMFGADLGSCGAACVTYCGTNMGVAIDEVTDSNGSEDAIFILANPTAGACTVVITPSASGATIEGASITVTKSNTSTASSAHAHSSGSTGTSTSVTLAAASTGDLVVDVLGGTTAGGTFTPSGSGQTTKWGPTTEGGQRAQGSIMPGAASVVPGWSWPSNMVFGYVAATFKHQ